MQVRDGRDPTEVLGPRAAALLIDLLVSALIAFSVLAAVKGGMIADAPRGGCSQFATDTGFTGRCVEVGGRLFTSTDDRFTLAIVLAVAGLFVNLVLLQGLVGASLGKLVMGLRVVDALGHPCGFARAATRFVILPVDLLVVGIVAVFATHPHRRLGDMVANTFVVAPADVGVPIEVLRAPIIHLPDDVVALPNGDGERERDLVGVGG